MQQMMGQGQNMDLAENLTRIFGGGQQPQARRAVASPSSGAQGSSATKRSGSSKRNQ